MCLSLTASNAILGIGFNVAAVTIQPWIQPEQCIDTDPIFRSKCGACVVVDLHTLRAGGIPTVNFTRLRVFVDERADGDRHQHGGGRSSRRG